MLSLFEIKQNEKKSIDSDSGNSKLSHIALGGLVGQSVGKNIEGTFGRIHAKSKDLAVVRADDWKNNLHKTYVHSPSGPVNGIKDLLNSPVNDLKDVNDYVNIHNISDPLLRISGLALGAYFGKKMYDKKYKNINNK